MKTTPLPLPAGAPPMPPDLDEVGAACFGRLVADVEALGLLARTDGALFESAARAYSRARALDGLVEQDGAVIDSHGQTVPHPALKASESCWKRFDVLCGRLGLSPGDRARLAVALPKEERGPLDRALAAMDGDVTVRGPAFGLRGGFPS